MPLANLAIGRYDCQVSVLESGKREGRVLADADRRSRVETLPIPEGGAAHRCCWLTYIEHQCIRLLRMDMSKDLVAASATPLVLAILAEGDSYGYAIIKRVAELSGGHLQWTDGMLYPVLHRLERQGHVAAKWSASENGRRRKYYRITREGRAQLAAQRQQWQVVDGTLRGIWMKACTA